METKADDELTSDSDSSHQKGRHFAMEGSVLNLKVDPQHKDGGWSLIS